MASALLRVVKLACIAGSFGVSAGGGAAIADPAAPDAEPAVRLRDEARDAAHAGKCETVAMLAGFARDADPAYYANVFVVDPAIAHCMTIVLPPCATAEQRIYFADHFALYGGAGLTAASTFALGLAASACGVDGGRNWQLNVAPIIEIANHRGDGDSYSDVAFGVELAFGWPVARHGNWLLGPRIALAKVVSGGDESATRFTGGIMMRASAADLGVQLQREDGGAFASGRMQVGLDVGIDASSTTTFLIAAAGVFAVGVVSLATTKFVD